jgi:hypothetical protein
LGASRGDRLNPGDRNGGGEDGRSGRDLIEAIVIGYEASMRVSVRRRARQLSIGPARNDLRQLALALLWLDKSGNAHDIADATAEWRNRLDAKPLSSRPY